MPTNWVEINDSEEDNSASYEAPILPPISDPVARAYYILKCAGGIEVTTTRMSTQGIRRTPDLGLGDKEKVQEVEVITISDDDDEPQSEKVEKSVTETVKDLVEEETFLSVEKNAGAKRMKLEKVDDRPETSSKPAGNLGESDQSELKGQEMINRLTHHFDELIKLYGHRLKEEEVLKLKKKFEKRLNAMNQDMNCQERLLLQLKLKNEELIQRRDVRFTTLQEIFSFMELHASVSKSSETLNQPNEPEVSESYRDAKQKRRIAKLEKALEKLRKTIHSAESAEMSLDDLDKVDSSYIYLDTYRKEYIRIYKKLMEVKDEKLSLGRAQEKKFKAHDTSQYPVVAERIESLVNERKIGEKFPNYSEILKVYESCNADYNMKLTDEEMSTFAKDTFTKVGERLQQRRKKDEEYDHNAYLYDDYAPGPIDENDEVLMEKLKMSKTVADEKTAKVLEEFSQQQEDRNEDEDEIENEDEDEDEDEDGDEDENEDENKDSDEGNLSSTHLNQENRLEPLEESNNQEKNKTAPLAESQ